MNWATLMIQSTVVPAYRWMVFISARYQVPSWSFVPDLGHPKSPSRAFFWARVGMWVGEMRDWAKESVADSYLYKLALHLHWKIKFSLGLVWGMWGTRRRRRVLQFDCFK